MSINFPDKKTVIILQKRWSMIKTTNSTYTVVNICDNYNSSLGQSNNAMNIRIIFTHRNMQFIVIEYLTIVKKKNYLALAHETISDTLCP